MKKTVRFLMLIAMLAVFVSLACITAAAHDSETVKIGVVDITVPEPVPGQPFGTATVAPGCGYTIKSSGWGYAGNSLSDVGNTVKDGYVYRLNVTLDVVSNHTYYSFLDVVKVRINGEQIYTYSSKDNNLSFYHDYDLTQKVESIPLIYAEPKPGDALQSDIVTAGASGFTVSTWWEDLTTGRMISDGYVFEQGHIYKGVVNIDRVSGYSFAENAPVFLNDTTTPIANANNEYAGCEIVLAFAESLKEIDLPAFPENVTVANGMDFEVAAAPETAAYTQTSQWTDIRYGHKAFYLATGNSYLLTYTVKAKEGYAFAEDILVKVGGVAATDTVEVTAGQIKVSRLYDFGAQVLDTFALKGLAMVRNGNTDILSTANNGYYSGNTEWKQNTSGLFADPMENALVFLDGYSYFYKTAFMIDEGYRIADQLKILVDGVEKEYVLLSRTSGEIEVMIHMGKLSADGVWTKEAGRWAYIGENGQKKTNCWRESNAGWRYLGEDGYAVTSQWRKDSKGWCYLDAEGLMAQNKWLRDSKGWCYVDGTGYCLTDMWVYDSKGPCYIGSDARLASNRWVNSNIEWSWMYADAEGRLVTNQWKKDGKYWYYLGSSGYTLWNSWVSDSKGMCYLGNDGKMATNQWINDYSGKGWRYVGADGYMKVNAWMKDSTGWCYLGADGYTMTNAWVKDSKGWCYIDASGYMVYNKWILDGGKWYYLDGNGYMLANTSRSIGGKTYHFNSSGVCTNP